MRFTAPARPLSLLIKPVSGRCNLDCRYCFYRRGREENSVPVMTRRTVDTLIAKLAEAAPASVSFAFQGGEPLLAGLDFYRYFTASAKQALPAPLSFSVQTNGTLVDDAFAAFFRENGFLVGVSVDGDRETHDRYRRDRAGNGVYARVLAGIDALKRQNAPFNILSVVDDANAADLPRTWERFRALDWNYLQFIPCIDGGTGVSLSAEAYERFLKQSFDLWYDTLMNGTYVSVRHIDNYVGLLMGRPPESCAAGGVCGGYCVVEADGGLYPCDFYCEEPWRLGSVYDAEPFAPNETQRLFTEQSLLIRETCKACRYFALCRGGCRRDRTADLLKNRYCEALRAFFDYAIDRMKAAAEAFL